MAKPTTRAEFIAYCKRSLGAPVVEINVDDDQIDDRVDEALDYFYQYHSDGSEKVFLKHQVIDSILTTSVVATNFNNGETVTGTTSGAKFTISSLGVGENYAGGGSAFGLGGEVTSGTFREKLSAELNVGTPVTPVTPATPVTPVLDSLLKVIVITDIFQ